MIMKTVTKKDKAIFKDISEGSLFILSEDDSIRPCIWVKIPLAFYNAKTPLVFHNAICINAGGRNLSMQCNPTAECFVLNADTIFDTADCCQSRK